MKERGSIPTMDARVRAYLRSAGFVPGERLPGERELAQVLDMSRTALRSALAALEASGTIERRPQSGTFLTRIPAPSARGARVTLIAPFHGNGRADQVRDSSWLFRVVSAFERTTGPAGMQIQLEDQSTRLDDSRSIIALARDVAAQRPQAVVLLHPVGTRKDIGQALTILHDQQVHPIIVSSRTYPGLASQVYFDSGWGAYVATRHLLQRGHRRIAFAGAPQGHEWVQDRLAGYQDALAAVEIVPDAAWVNLPNDGERLAQPSDGEDALQRWLRLPAEIRPTAVDAANDVVALGLLGAAREAGIEVPDALSVVGFDNDPEALLAGLTTIERPIEALGEALARTTLDRVAGGSHADAVTVRLRPVLIERATVGAPTPEPGSGSPRTTRNPGVISVDQ